MYIIKPMDKLFCNQCGECCRKIAVDFKKNLMLPGCAGLKYFPDKGFTVQVLFESTPNGWNEVESTKFKKKTDIRLNAAVGEVKQAYPVVLRLTREQNGEQQQIYIFGDADCLSNFNIHRYNRDIVQELLGDRLITYSKKTRLNKSISVPKGKKESLRVTLKDLNTWQIILGGVFPAVCVLIAFVIWKRRMNR